MWVLSTAIPKGLETPVIKLWFTFCPSKSARPIEPGYVVLVQYTWRLAPPFPLSVILAVAEGFRPSALNVALTWPELVGPNWTTTPHDFAGPRLVPLQPSFVMVNIGESKMLILSTALPDRPLLVKVNNCETVCPTGSVP